MAVGGGCTEHFKESKFITFTLYKEGFCSEEFLLQCRKMTTNIPFKVSLRFFYTPFAIE